MTWRVLVTATSFGKVSNGAVRELEAAGCGLVTNPHGRPLTEAELAELVVGVDGVIAGVDPFTASVLAHADRLRVIARRGAGLDGIDLAAATRRGIAVTNTPGANSAAVADLVLGLMLAMARGLVPAARNLKEGRWVRPLGGELRGKTLGIVGFGRIGREVARRAGGFGMRLLAHDPFWSQQNAAALGVARADLDTVLAEADFVSLHLPLNPSTDGLIGEALLRRMRPTAFLINTARGELIDEAALVRVLQEHRIAGAALDVFRQEPPFGSPLLDLPNVLATPHLASQSREAVEAMDREAVRNLLEVLAGRRPADLCNQEVWTA
ncbi:MAG TPA: phosphoglycerate dehydrogenase [Symbiobacteriaceae bacterium]|nr:phosphoglycerate dehydrogenase [Symbiobacteriaceae bacterium]